MAEDLLSYYNAELAYFRELAGSFAEANPAAAGRLRLTRDAIDDPHVERLIEAVAFLTARVRRKIEDDFPELTDAVLEILYPHYLRPVPSMTILRFRGDPEMAEPYEVAAGTEVETEIGGGGACRFRTAYPATLWPVRLGEARLMERPYTVPPGTGDPNAGAVLHLRFDCLAEGASFTDLGVDRLRLFLRGPRHQTMPLYECLMNRVTHVAVAEGADDAAPTRLGRDAVRAVGFERGEGMIPYPAASFLGYRLLTEYFAFPDKFLFVDLAGLEARTLLGAGSQLHVYVFLTGVPADLARAVTRESFVLGCAPAVNLFRQRAEPIRLTGRESRHRVEADARRPDSVEVWSVDSVAATDPDGTRRDYAPFYGLNHGAGADAGVFWFPTRGEAPPERGGTEVWLTLTEPDLAPAARPGATLSVETTCLNRNLPAKLPFGGGQPAMALAEPAGAVAGVECLTPPTPTLRPPLGNGARWRLISHLALNHLSLMGEGASEALRETLRLYDFRDDPETRAAIEAISRIDAAPGAARVPGRAGPVACRGVEAELEIDPEGFHPGGAYLAAAVLERFLTLHVGINGYVRLTAGLKGRPGRLARWAPRSGDRVLI